VAFLTVLVSALSIAAAHPPAEPPFTLSWPAEGTVTDGFGPRWGRMHTGLDIGILTRLSVTAAAPGTVEATGALEGYAGYGNVVLIKHGDGRETLYAHLSHIRAEPGQQVEAGTWIGTAGCTGSCTGTHLHFELRKHGIPVDPMPLLASKNARAGATLVHHIHRGGKVRGECLAKAPAGGCPGGRDTRDRRYRAGSHPGIK
jgi:murein DD-endopeptidase MepM/ murein hydrolase activator NlpD